MKNKNQNISTRDKILIGMDKVYVDLLNYKKKMNSDLVVYRDGKILYIKPE